MEVQSFSNVWDALTDTPAEAANMTMRSNLMIAIQRAVEGWGVTQEVTAKRLGINRPRVSELLTGKISRFSLDALVNLASRAGIELDLRVHDQRPDTKIFLGEERLLVGKREVGRGSGKVRSYIVEHPVNEQVSLREERVTLEHSPVNQTVTSADALFRERTMETTDVDERAIAGKRTVITEELNFRKDVEQRTETISDTVRHTEVEVGDTQSDSGTEHPGISRRMVEGN